MDITPFLPMITGAIGGAASAGVFKGPIQTLEDLWYSNFGYKAADKAAILKAKQEINIEKLRESTLANVEKIKPENIQEPKLSIIGPAIEASRFYIEEEELRNMFAKLIASSMDKEKNSIIHPSFVEVVKQLSSEDAIFLKEFQKYGRLPYGKITAVEEKKNTIGPKSNLDTAKNSGIFKSLEIPSLEDLEKEFATKSQPFVDFFYYSNDRREFGKNDFSISSLSRLGLITVKEGVRLTDSSAYTEIEKEFSLMKKQLEKEAPGKHIPEDFHLHLEKGVIDLSPFGSSFLGVCI